MSVHHFLVAAVLVGLACRLSAGSAGASPSTYHAGIALRREQAEVLLVSGEETLGIALTCPKFVFDGATAGGAQPTSVRGDVKSGGLLEVSFDPIAVAGGHLNVKLWAEWSGEESLLRKWVTLKADKPLLLKEIVLEEIEAAGRAVNLAGAPPQSYPAFLKGFFAGVEFPMASTRLEGGRLVVAHRPGLRLEPGKWYSSRKAVFGIAPPGEEQRAFENYVLSHRPPHKGLHVNYNSWWTSPVPYSEKDILGLMDEFRRNLYEPYNCAPDTFAIDLGWSDPKSLWEIDNTRFPKAFERIAESARKMGSALGLWISPSACYPPALDTEWAKEQGYETFAVPNRTRLSCLGGSRYASAFRERLVDMVKRWGIGHIKLDGYALTCPETDHGHEPGPDSCEAVAEGGISAFEAVHKAAPDVWLEATCFGWNPSPWWLFYVDSVIGTYGDDAPWGRVPCPVSRESYTSARDFFNLQGAARLPIPACAQEVLGIIHQTQEPFTNDAVATILRGYQFLPLYVNPAHMNERRWRDLADILTWARRNADILSTTKPILPASWQGGRAPAFVNDAVMPREPYGYAHGDGKRSLVLVRNPWIAPTKLTLRLDDELGLEPDGGVMSARSIYPERRTYGERLRFGDRVQLPLAPYETVLLSIGPSKPGPRPISAAASLGRRIRFRLYKNDAAPVDGAEAVRSEIEADVIVSAPQAELLILLEDSTPPAKPSCKVWVDGVEQEVTESSSAGAWSASTIPGVEHWLFLRTKLSPRKQRIRIEPTFGGKSADASVWVLASKPGRAAKRTGSALPEPEVIYLDAARIAGPILGCHSRE